MTTFGSERWYQRNEEGSSGGERARNDGLRKMRGKRKSGGIKPLLQNTEDE
jgi:hypothetical protein